MNRRQLLQALALLSPAVAWSQGGTSRHSTIHYVVPFPPGGLTDTMARAVGERLGHREGHTVVIDNRPGGNAQIGTDVVAKAAGDGQNLLAVTLAHAANVTLYKGKSPFELQRDLRTVALLAGSPMLIVVPARSGIRNMQDLVEQAKSRPLNAGSSGNGTPPHLTQALFANQWDVNMQHVPYKGGAPSIADLIGGQLDVIFSNFPESLAHVKGGRLHALAVTSPERHPELPDVPTTAQVGMPELRVENWTGVMVPSGTSDEIVARLGVAIVAIMREPAIAKRATTQGFRVDPRGPAEFSAFLNAEIERWAKVIERADIQVF